MRLLVVGGAGYIGSHMLKALHLAGHDMVVLDNLSTGWRDAVCYGSLIEGDAADIDLLKRLFQSYRFDAVMHFASSIQVGESVVMPARYYRNNFSATLVLLDAMVEAGVGKFIFSSTAAIFGEPQYVPIDEGHPKAPMNPYGRSKWMVEQMLEDYGRAYGLRHVALRYFNAAGADPEGELGERHQPETHLIPLVLEAAAGNRQSITVFGEDYDTPDGTCIRDYVHVADLCAAHLQAVDYLAAGGQSAVFNLGNGGGHSVREVIDTARRVTQRAIRVDVKARREGDPARLVADATLARKVLGWAPRYGDLATIITHAWQWELRRGSAG
jgi:UDP-glucose 4-epimerase